MQRKLLVAARLAGGFVVREAAGLAEAAGHCYAAVAAAVGPEVEDERRAVGQAGEGGIEGSQQQAAIGPLLPGRTDGPGEVEKAAGQAHVANRWRAGEINGLQGFKDRSAPAHGFEASTLQHCAGRVPKGCFVLAESRIESVAPGLSLVKRLVSAKEINVAVGQRPHHVHEHGIESGRSCLGRDERPVPPVGSFPIDPVKGKQRIMVAESAPENLKIALGSTWCSERAAGPAAQKHEADQQPSGKVVHRPQM